MIRLAPDERIVLVRYEMSGGEAVLLSAQVYREWPALLDALRSYGVPVTPENEAEIASHRETQFENPILEVINSGRSARTCHVKYNIEVAGPAQRAEIAGVIGVKEIPDTAEG